jgi:hypothetical protein
MNVASSKTQDDLQTPQISSCYGIIVVRLFYDRDAPVESDWVAVGLVLSHDWVLT